MLDKADKERLDKTHLIFQTWRCIPALIRWQIEQRESLTPSIDPAVRAGINFSIILGSACYVEGSLEEGLIKILDKEGIGSSKLSERLSLDLRLRISATIGADRYDDIFALITGRRANEILSDSQLWETIKVLFQFRNVIAHGRAVKYTLYSPPNVGGLWADESSGGYKIVEEYLLKKGLLTERYIEVANDWLFFTDSIADFFWQSAQDFITKLGDNLLGEAQSAFKEATRL